MPHSRRRIADDPRHKWDFIVWMLEDEREDGIHAYSHQHIAGRVKWLKLHDLGEAITSILIWTSCGRFITTCADTRQFTAAQQKAYEVMIKDLDCLVPGRIQTGDCPVLGKAPNPGSGIQ
jgi:hypothetical protein